MEKFIKDFYKKKHKDIIELQAQCQNFKKNILFKEYR